MTLEDEARCGRTTASTRKPCRGFRLSPFPACATHLTDEERTQYEARKAEQSKRWGEPYRRYRGDLQLSAPSCWSWPITRPQSAEVLHSVTADGQFESEDRADTALAQWQAGRCAICGRTDQLVVDHDHKTGLVRGHLCRQCNTLEGVDGRTGTVFQRYRELPPARILGIRIRYWDPYTQKFARPAPDEDDAQGANNPLAQIGRAATEQDRSSPAGDDV